eukprot:scaffold111532_cov37-Prasinocladus_malaysianus.AAC.1
MRWGDSLDDDDDTLPPTSVSGPDKNGIKIITEYLKNEKGQTVKRTTKVKVIKVEKKIYKVCPGLLRITHRLTLPGQETIVTVFLGCDVAYHDPVACQIGLRSSSVLSGPYRAFAHSGLKE